MAEGININKSGKLEILWHKSFCSFINKKVTGLLPVTDECLCFNMQAEQDTTRTIIDDILLQFAMWENLQKMPKN